MKSAPCAASGLDPRLVPDIPASIIAVSLAREGTFVDKSDVYRHACDLKLACLGDLSAEVLRALDPLSKDGVLSPQVRRYVSSLNRRLVSFDEAVRRWGLSAEELDKLAAHKKASSKATFYRLKDVRRISAMKHDGNPTRLLERAYPGARERIALLLEELSKQNLAMRMDSAACSSFIESGRGRPEDIARRLKEMDFYHTYTDYKEIFDYFTDKYRVEYGYYDRDHISKDAKALALSAFLKEHPDKRHLVPESLERFFNKKAENLSS